MSTYDRLLECADTCIQENGFEGFSYADLAKTLGIRKASIHHHFPTKNDLGLAYCEKKQPPLSNWNNIFCHSRMEKLSCMLI